MSSMMRFVPCGRISPHDAEETITNVPYKLNCFGVTNEFQRPQHFHVA
jgi:hypothetical protein